MTAATGRPRGPPYGRSGPWLPRRAAEQRDEFAPFHCLTQAQDYASFGFLLRPSNTKLRPAKWDAVVNLRRQNSEPCISAPGHLETSRASRRIYKHMREA